MAPTLVLAKTFILLFLGSVGSPAFSSKENPDLET